MNDLSVHVKNLELFLIPEFTSSILTPSIPTPSIFLVLVPLAYLCSASSFNSIVWGPLSELYQVNQLTIISRSNWGSQPEPSRVRHIPGVKRLLYYVYLFSRHVFTSECSRWRWSSSWSIRCGEDVGETPSLYWWVPTIFFGGSRIVGGIVPCACISNSAPAQGPCMVKTLTLGLGVSRKRMLERLTKENLSIWQTHRVWSLDRSEVFELLLSDRRNDCRMVDLLSTTR